MASKRIMKELKDPPISCSAGDLLSSAVVRDKRIGKTKGHGFVSFSNPTDLAAAIKEMNVGEIRAADKVLAQVLAHYRRCFVPPSWAELSVFQRSRGYAA